jgi:hypothetical protein
MGIEYPRPHGVPRPRILRKKCSGDLIVGNNINLQTIEPAKF